MSGLTVCDIVPVGDREAWRWGGLGTYKGRYFGESSEVEIEFCYSHEIQNNIGAKVFIP
jgi:hypothetical protein